jgi:dTDP-4-dehydrorhamnose reductase
VKIVVLGRDGQVGWELQRALAPLGDVAALAREGAENECGDLENPDGLRRALRRLNPDIIANAAAFTDVERAESEPERTNRVNAEGAEILANEAKRLDAWLIHYSTDYIFDGSGAKPWQEDDEAAPLNVYGRTKWQSEQIIRGIGCRHLILRTQWIYSARGRNFVRTMLRLAAERETMEIVDDQVGAPTGADLIADVTAHVVRALTASSESDTYHLAARGETSWYGYARFLIESARRAGWPLRLTENGITRAASESSAFAARRPRNSRLCVDRLERTFNLRMPHWRIGVTRVLAELGETRA